MATHTTKWDLGDTVQISALDCDALVVQITITFGRPKYCVRYWLECKMTEEWVYECELTENRHAK
jgi:hypothetical protein